MMAAAPVVSTGFDLPTIADFDSEGTTERGDHDSSRAVSSTVHGRRQCPEQERTMRGVETENLRGGLKRETRTYDSGVSKVVTFKPTVIGRQIKSVERKGPKVR